jgi:hypothetical protein
MNNPQPAGWGIRESYGSFVLGDSGELRQLRVVGWNEHNPHPAGWGIQESYGSFVL